ncbi:MAG: PAS domain-containing protein, partial [Ideonella sp.]|nr:PAS domain-containing protein [Ideonella sp.]
MASFMHQVWQMSPAPALHVAPSTAGSGPLQCLVNEAAERCPVLAGWGPDDWQRLGRSILARAAAGVPVQRASDTPDGVGWRAVPWEGGQLAWLEPAADGSEVDRAGESLRELSERLEVVQEFGRIGSWVRDVRTGRGQWDRHTFRLFGIAEHEGTPDFIDATAGIHPDDRARVREVYQASLAQPGRYETHFRVVRPGGALIRVRSTWRVEGPDGRRPLRAIGVLVDETEHVEAL